MSLYNGETSVVCPSVRPSVNFCANRFFSQANGRIANKLAHDGLQVSLHPGCAQVKVKVKGHVIRALLCWHENRFFSQANGPIATKLAHDGHQVSLHPGCAQRSRSKVTWYAHFLGFLEWATPSLTVWFNKQSRPYMRHPRQQQQEEVWRRTVAACC